MQPTKQNQLGSDYDRDMVLMLNITAPNTDVILPVHSYNATYLYNLDVDYGDGTRVVYDKVSSPITKHTYLTPGKYELRISGIGTCTTFSFNYYWNYSGDLLKYFDNLRLAITEIKNFGEIKINGELSFYRCSNLTKIVELLPNTITISTDLNRLFAETSICELPKNFFTSVNTRLITSLSATFYQTCITEIPDNFLSTLTRCQSYSYTFYGNRSLTKIGKNVFPKITNELSSAGIGLQETFRDCVSLTEIDENIFQCFNAPNITTINAYGTFNSAKITKLTAAHFNGLKFYQTSYMFYNNALYELPYDLLYGQTSLNDAQYMFAQNVISQVDENFFRDCTSLSNISYFFSGNMLLSIPERLLYPLGTKLTWMQATFNNNLIKEIPALLFAQTPNVANLEGCFSNTLIKSLPAQLLYPLTKLTSVKSCFTGTLLESIPANFFDMNLQLADIFGCFTSTLIKEIPQDIFKLNTKITTINSCFSSCRYLTALPSKLFYYVANVDSLQGMFSYCDMLESIPDDIWDQTKVFTSVTSASNSFYSCVNLKQIPENLFWPFPNITMLYSAFESTGSIEVIPALLFKNMSKVTSIERIFYAGNNPVKILPEGLLDSMVALQQAQCAFNGFLIKSIPANFLKYNVALTNITGMFQNNRLLESLPDTLFATNTLLTNVNSCFYGCSRLTSIPLTLFDNCKKITGFSGTFTNCYIIDPVPALWLRTAPDYTVPTSTSGCFTGNYGCYNYLNIPASWK